MVDVGHVIHGMLEASGLSAPDVSRKVGRSRTWVATVGNPRRDPSLSTVARVADACGYRVAVLDGDGREVLTVEPPPESPLGPASP